MTETSPPVSRPADETEHLAFIDALRGWAFLAVLAVHVHATGTVPEVVRRIQQSGNYGVQLFFVISATTLFMSFESRRKRDRKPVAAFFVRRLFRIAPLFWLAIPFGLWQHGLSPRDSAPDGLHWPQIVSTMVFLHGWHPTSINSVVPGGWSIAVEMNFYLLLPVCFVLLNSLRRSLFAGGATLVLSIVICLIAKKGLMKVYPVEQTELIQSFLYYWLPRQLPVFALGFILYFLIRSIPSTRGSGPVEGGGAKTAIAVQSIALGWIALLVLVGHRLPLTYFWFSLGFMALALGLSLRPLSLLVNPITRYVGKVSYSAYITHFFVIDEVSRLQSIPDIRDLQGRYPVAGLLVAYLTCLAGTMVLSTLTHYLIEIPGQNVGKRLIEHFEWGRPRTTPVVEPGIKAT
jgi:peptidoglycan/LPS O-acetylase OafA/YrhL